jgi:hypothetical protein
MKFEVGNKVKIVSSENGSTNEAGDVGIIIEYDLDEKDGLDYRVIVDGRLKTMNWHSETELELIQD